MRWDFGEPHGSARQLGRAAGEPQGEHGARVGASATLSRRDETTSSDSPDDQPHVCTWDVREHVRASRTTRESRDTERS